MSEHNENEERFRSAFGRRLVLAFDKRGLTREEVAELADVSHTTIFGYTSGQRKAGLWETVKMARVLGVSLDWLTGYKPKTARCVYEYNGRGSFICSHCHYSAGMMVKSFDYCPKCGALITGKKTKERGYI